MTGIAKNSNHSKDNLFTAWEKMEEEQPIIENDLEVDYSLFIWQCYIRRRMTIFVCSLIGINI